ncbi:hypothetical protein EVAR_70506_1 [Eumeta japonica]|uniref:Mariner Mos1 transposase n=1 Tax=Eumeta variegata TaxID=151549 RepID=A0A4C1SLB1_EUMVA|nr:hypothetical protein EVAR_70506_1 [Eumeta japonica]
MALNLVWNIVTGDETRIYCYDPKTKQQSTVRLYRHESKLTKVARERSSSKRMVASFFNKTGHVLTVVLENCRTVNSDWYTIICFSEVIDELLKNNRKLCIILHNDNASFHTAKQTNKVMKKKNIQLSLQEEAEEERYSAIPARTDRPPSSLLETQDLYTLVQSQNIHIFLLSETKLLPKQELRLPNFVYCRDEVSPRGTAFRGTAVLVRRNIVHGGLEQQDFTDKLSK